ncbi:MAG TPA: urease accessory protein UreE [Steroidobacteraceae bacterium]|nr:urease accessory protein UreE [Steroidobacteraceae bacterium]
MTSLTITQRLDEKQPAQARLVLPFESRQKSRLLSKLDSGEEVGVVLDRGVFMRGGDCLLASDGRVIEVVAADEQVSVVTASDPWQLARAAYHLGNRHVSLQVGQGWLRYLHDHVLDDMVRGLGFHVSVECLPFEPEGGAYSHSGNTHHHSFVLNMQHPHSH